MSGGSTLGTVAATGGGNSPNYSRHSIYSGNSVINHEESCRQQQEGESSSDQQFNIIANTNANNTKSVFVDDLNGSKLDIETSGEPVASSSSVGLTQAENDDGENVAGVEVDSDNGCRAAGMDRSCGRGADGLNHRHGHSHRSHNHRNEDKEEQEEESCYDGGEGSQQTLVAVSSYQDGAPELANGATDNGEAGELDVKRTNAPLAADCKASVASACGSSSIEDDDKNFSNSNFESRCRRRRRNHQNYHQQSISETNATRGENGNENNDDATLSNPPSVKTRRDVVNAAAVTTKDGHHHHLRPRLKLSLSCSDITSLSHDTSLFSALSASHSNSSSYSTLSSSSSSSSSLSLSNNNSSSLKRNRRASLPLNFLTANCFASASRLSSSGTSLMVRENVVATPTAAQQPAAYRNPNQYQNQNHHYYPRRQYNYNQSTRQYNQFNPGVSVNDRNNTRSNYQHQQTTYYNVNQNNRPYVQNQPNVVLLPTPSMPMLPPSSQQVPVGQYQLPHHQQIAMFMMMQKNQQQQQPHQYQHHNVSQSQQQQTGNAATLPYFSSQPVIPNYYFGFGPTTMPMTHNVPHPNSSLNYRSQLPTYQTIPTLFNGSSNGGGHPLFNYQYIEMQHQLQSPMFHPYAQQQHQHQQVVYTPLSTVTTTTTTTTSNGNYDARFQHQQPQHHHSRQQADELQLVHMQPPNLANLIASSKFKLGYDLISSLPIEAEPTKTRQAYGMDKVWLDEFEQLFCQFPSRISWTLIEVETNPSIREPPNNIVGYRGRYVISLSARDQVNSGADGGDGVDETINLNSQVHCEQDTHKQEEEKGQREEGEIKEGDEDREIDSDCDSGAMIDSTSGTSETATCSNNDSVGETACSESPAETSSSSDLDTTATINTIQTSGESSVESPAVGIRKFPTRFRMFIDSAKVRFCCDLCGHGWTSMKGRVVFWYELFELVGRDNSFDSNGTSDDPSHLVGYCAYKLFGQQCDVCKIENRFERPMWYPEEVTKALGNLYNKIGQVYFGFKMPAIDKQRRAGKPKTSHNSSLCQACHDGVCTDRK